MVLLLSGVKTQDLWGSSPELLLGELLLELCEGRLLYPDEGEELCLFDLRCCNGLGVEVNSLLVCGKRRLIKAGLQLWLDVRPAIEVPGQAMCHKVLVDLDAWLIVVQPESWGSLEQPC